MNGSGLQLAIGGSVIPGQQLTTFSIVEAINSDATLHVELPRDLLAEYPADFRGIIELGPIAGQPGPSFGGWVTNVDVSGPIATIDARSAPWLDEGLIATFVVAATPAERIWAFVRLAGLASTSIHVGDLPAPERFMVAAPIENVLVSDEVTIVGVTFTSEAPAIAPLVAWVPQSSDRSASLDASCWALVDVDGERTLLDAEAKGLQAVEGALDRLALDAQYSRAVLPTGEWRSFRRTQLFADPTLRPLVVVAARSGRHWLRSLEHVVYERNTAATDRPMVTPLPGQFRRFDEALAAWRRATRTRNPTVVAVALWEALEFYAAETRLPTLFEPAHVDAIAAAIDAVPGLSDEQRARAARLVKEQLNASPIMARLRVALNADGVPYSNPEIEALSRVRKPRNRYQHGELSEPPSEADIELAKGFVGRVLAHRGARLSL